MGKIDEILKTEEYPAPSETRLRPVTAEERELYTKYCPSAKSNHELYVSDGVLERVDNRGQVIMYGANARRHVPVLYIDFGEGAEIQRVNQTCVLCDYDKKLNVDGVKGDPLRLFWSKSDKGYTFRFAILKDAVEPTAFVKCRICSREQRTKDLIDGEKCIYCGLKYNPSFFEAIKLTSKKSK